MEMPVRSQTTIAIASVLAVFGCADDRLPIREASEHLILRVPSGLEVCGGTFSTMESEVIRIRELFGARAGTVDYTWMPRSHYGREEFPCVMGASGCAGGLLVFDRAIANTHELVHAARSGMPAAFEEGLATLLTAPIAPETPLAPREQLFDALVGSWPEDGALYPRAAHFVSFLIADEGIDTFGEFDRRVRYIKGTRDATFAEWVGVFEDVYGATFEEMWTAYADYPDCPAVQFHRPLTACAALAERTPEATLVAPFLGEAGPDASFKRSFNC